MGEDVYGDFEDLETSEKFGPGAAANVSDDSSSPSEEEGEDLDDDRLREKNKLQKANFKSSFDDKYDAEKKEGVTDVAHTNPDDQAEEEYLEALKREKEKRELQNRTEFGSEGEHMRLRHEGFRQGLYVRVKLDNVPVEFIRSFNPDTPLVLGGLLPNEMKMGMIRCRFKKHRWHKKVSKPNTLCACCGFAADF